VTYDHLAGICRFEVTMDGLMRPDFEWRHEHMVYEEEYDWTVTRA